MKEPDTSAGNRSLQMVGPIPSACIKAAAKAFIAKEVISLRSRFGWVGATLEVRFDVKAQLLMLTGSTVTRKTLHRMVKALEKRLPPSLEIHFDGVTDARGVWMQATTATFVMYDAPISVVRRQAVTEWLSTEPVEVLTTCGPSSLIRTIEGTVGWIECQAWSRPKSLPTQLRFNTDLLAARLSSYLGTPYLLGGATRHAIDCSALIQVVYRDAVAWRIPRNSRDMLAICQIPLGRVPQPGDLLIGVRKGDGQTHVGAIVPDVQRGCVRVLHASVSRNRVLLDNLSSFFKAFDEVTTVSSEQLGDYSSDLIARKKSEVFTEVGSNEGVR